MSNVQCCAMPLGNSKNASSKNTSCLPSTEERCFCKENKENVGDASGKGGWLAKVCNKLRGQHKPRRRPEKCEKCGQRSDTCRPNASFITSRKHYLCEDCRVSSDNMKTMYHQLCRNLSLRDPPRPACDSGTADMSPSPPMGSRRSGVVRSRSMRTRPTAGAESGYDTATSLDSSCGSNSFGRLSPEPLSSGCGGGSADRSETGPWVPLDDCPRLPVDDWSADPQNACYKDRCEVFGAAFKSEQAHLRQLQNRPKPKVYTRQPRAAPSPSPAPHHHHHHHPAQQDSPSHPHPQKQPLAKDTAQYDGYLEIRTPNSQSVKYVFRPRENQQQQQKQEESEHLPRRRYSENLKLCYRCSRYRCVAFRAPFGNGWLCEDCMDDLM